MLLAAFLHAGLPQDHLVNELQTIPELDFTLQLEEEHRAGIGCHQLTVHPKTDQQFRHLHNILEILAQSGLKKTILEQASQIFTRLAEVEAKVHNTDIANIHFHEVGAVDTIVDITGALLALDYFGIDEVICSPLPMGRGFVRCAHGNLPLPAPAVAELLKEVPVYGVNQDKELVTPTGAVLATELTDSFGDLPTMQVQTIGYGAGNNRLNNDQPNLLRLFIGEKKEVDEAQRVEVIECTLDDWNTELFPHLLEQLFSNGALDVSLAPLLVKKGRPAHRLQVVAAPTDGYQIREIILRQTSTLGLRYRQEKRMTLAREAVELNTPYGMVQAKRVTKPDGVTIYPEYEACKAVATAHNVALERVYRAVIQAGEEQSNG